MSPPLDSSRSTTPTGRINAASTTTSTATAAAAAASSSLSSNYTSGALQPQQERLRNGAVSPPRTPPRRRKEPPSSYPKSARLAAATGVPVYSEDSTTDDDNEDPHDLNYSSKHFPRASMVDNMVLALDQFSHLVDPKPYEEDRRTTNNRGRGHTFSSSVSSDSDIRTLQTQFVSPAATKPMRRSSARYNRDPSKLPSIFGEDEDSARVRVYEAQRAAPSNKKSHRSRNGDGKANGSASSIDLSHLKLLQGKLGPAGNRRSQSFDFGSRRRTNDEDPNATAPHPVVYAGPKAQNYPGSPALPPAAFERRGSAVSTRAPKSKPPPLKSGALHNVPPTQSNATANSPSGKRSPTPGEHASVSKSGGLFKRFFGSAKAAAPPAAPTSAPADILSPGIKDSTGSASKSARSTHKDSLDLREKDQAPAPVLTKKPSSFFRRRKKSITTAAVPSLPLTIDSSLAQSDKAPGQPSPVSSLKAFMDPYLADEKPTLDPRSATSPLRTSYIPTAASTTNLRSDNREPSKQSSRNDNLALPSKETFLTDSSSCEGDTTSDQDATPLQRKQVFDTQKATIRAASTTPTHSTIRPVIESRSTSWNTGHLGVPARKESLPALDMSKVNQAKSKVLTEHRNTSGSDISVYKSAPSTPAITTAVEATLSPSPRLHVSHPSLSVAPTLAILDKAQHIYNNGEEEVDGDTAAAWLGEAGSERERIRQAYMELYDWSGHTILAALRSLCSRLVLKAESQLIDRILVAFSTRWCTCNPSHGFKSSDVVHTICYSILLLNTDLHMADIGSKMTQKQFVRNSMQTIKPVVADDTDLPQSSLMPPRSNSYGPSAGERVSTDNTGSRAASSLGHRPTEQLARSDSSGPSEGLNGPLVEAPFSGSQAGWELQIEGVLKEFYFSIQREPLPLFGSETANKYPPTASSNNLLGLNTLRRTPSVLSKAQSERERSRFGDSRSLGSKWNNKRSRPRLGSSPGFASSKNSLDDQSSAWSPSMSSTWSKASLGKTLTSMSVDSFATSAGMGNDYQSSIGFANALSQAIIREDQIETSTDDGMRAAPLLEDETLELEGAPWAKEGMLKHKCHLEGVDKRSKDRQWNDCFAVIEKGWMRLFSFSVTAKSLRNKARNNKPVGVVGGGNWQDNAEEVWKFMLRHTIASSLPPPGYSKARPHVWALSLPTGAVHLFSVGTPDIVKEFVSTANYWSARLSKEPMIGGITSMEYGWSDTVVSRTLTGSEVRPSFTSSDLPRPSTQMSIRSSLDYSSSSRPKLPGDKVHISDWAPPTQSLYASQLMEIDQLKALQTYVANVEEDLQRHNELRGPMLLAFSTKHSNYNRAMSNWEKKSSYLLREIVKFKNYIDALNSAALIKDKIYKMREEEEKTRRLHDDDVALYTTSSMAASD